MGRCHHGFARSRILVIEDESLITTIVVIRLTDLPVMDGRAFLRELWCLEGRTRPPVVLMSGAGGPFSLEHLLAVVAWLAT